MKTNIEPFVVWNIFVTSSECEFENNHMDTCATQFSALETLYEWQQEAFPEWIATEYFHMDDSVTVEFETAHYRKHVANAYIEPITVTC